MTLAISMFAGDAGKSGISEYMRQTLSEMLQQTDQQQFVLFMCHADRPHFDPQHPRAKVVAYHDRWGNPLLSIIWHLFWLPIALRLHRCRAVFMPAANRRLSLFYGVPSVGTVHDFSQLHVPAKYDKFRMFYIMRCLPMMMRRLSRVVSISRSTRKDLIEFAGVSDERIEVIYNGASLSQAASETSPAVNEVFEKFGLSNTPYLLYVSRIEHPGKNHINLLKAFSYMKREYNIEHKLVFVGSRWSGAEVVDQTILDLGLDAEVIQPGFVSSEVLNTLYREAELFVFPSLFEGFGIPLLEAMSAGTAVCSSDRASMPEVVGDAGLLFDPEDCEAIASAIYRVISNPLQRKEMEVRGVQRAKAFTWAQSARQVLAVIDELMIESYGAGISVLANTEVR